ncbi:MAG: 3-hydroxyacyl-CoA dehydrogenase family protein [Anaerovoracaceae bacterium]
MKKIKKVTVYGMGLIGAGWVTHLLIKGIEDIKVFDLNDDALDRGFSILNRNMDFLVEQEVIDEETKKALITKIERTTDIGEAVKDADLIIENGPENMQIKQCIIADIESACKAEAMITSSTSGLLISGIIEKAIHPERIIGAHPYHPVYLLPLIEMIKSDKTSQECIDTVMGFFKDIDKKPVLLKKESDGYIGSHLMTALLREAVNLVITGVGTVEDIDDAFTYGPGMRYGLFGIFTTFQLTGGDKGFSGVVNGPIGKAGEKWLQSFANWREWPEEVKIFFANSQKEIDKMMANRDEYHGRNNAELEDFRDKGLVKLLQAHHLI